MTGRAFPNAGKKMVSDINLLFARGRALSQQMIAWCPSYIYTTSRPGFTGPGPRERTMARLSHRDLRRLSDGLLRLYAIRDRPALVAHLPTFLLFLFQTDFATSFEADLFLRHGRSARRAPDPLTEGQYRLLQQYYVDHPIVRYCGTNGDIGRAFRLSDFVSRRQWHDLAVYQECYKADGVEHQLGVSVPLTAARTISLVLHRGGRTDFTAQDQTLLDLLRPHVAQAWRLAETFPQGQPDPTSLHDAPEPPCPEIVAESSDGPDPAPLHAWTLEPLGLTPREAEVLLWVSQGKTNPEIGLILGISPITVRTHVERIFRKLGVANRTAAAVRALELTKRA
jgi:DNA-binding CsgD family transcriptional regulator